MSSQIHSSSPAWTQAGSFKPRSKQGTISPSTARPACTGTRWWHPEQGWQQGEKWSCDYCLVGEESQLTAGCEAVFLRVWKWLWSILLLRAQNTSGRRLTETPCLWDRGEAVTRSRIFLQISSRMLVGLVPLPTCPRGGTPRLGQPPARLGRTLGLALRLLGREAPIPPVSLFPRLIIFDIIWALRIDFFIP